MVVVGLLVVVVVSVLVARAGLAYLDGAKSVRRPASAPTTPTIDLTDRAPGHGSTTSPQDWVGRGFASGEAIAWIELGFDPDHAFLFRSLRIDASTAARLRSAGLEDSALAALVEEASFAHFDGHALLVALAESAPHLAPQAITWLRLGATIEQALAYAAEGFTPAASDPWRAVGWDLDDALPWFAARFEPTPARAWRDSGFDAREASAWKREHFGVRQALEWRRLGDTPAEAREVEQRFLDARVTVTEGLQWLGLGFTVDEICAGWPGMAHGDDARRWRTEWRRLALSPTEVSAWHAKFDRDETTTWIDAGVRDPAAALRLRARGIDPADVATVAQSLGPRAPAPVTPDDLLSAAGQLAGAGGSPELRRRLQLAAGARGSAHPGEISVDLLDDVLDELQRLADLGQLRAPHAARALARRFERGLIIWAMSSGRGRSETPRAS